MCSSSAVAKSTVSIDGMLVIHSTTIHYIIVPVEGYTRTDAFYKATLSHSFAHKIAHHIILRSRFNRCAFTLTFVQLRPIGLGIKNNLGSLYRLRALLFSRPRYSFILAPLIRRTFREVSLDIYSRTSCSWRSLLRLSSQRIVKICC